MMLVQPSTTPTKAIPHLELMGSTFLMGSSFVAAKTLLNAGFPALTLVGWRFLVAALAILPLVIANVRPDALSPPSLFGRIRIAVILVVIGLLQTAGSMGLLFESMRSISASRAAVLLATNPIWVAILSVPFLGEPIRRMRMVGLALGFIGVALIVGVAQPVSPGESAISGEATCMMAAICWALATIIVKRTNVPLDPWSFNFSQMAIGGLALLAIATAGGEQWPDSVSPSQWAAFLWLAIPASAGSFGLWFVALRKGDAVRTSGYLFLAPLFATAMSVGLLGARPGWFEAAGGILICVSIWLVNRERESTRYQS